jgi:hypothetical protein
MDDGCTETRSRHRDTETLRNRRRPLTPPVVALGVPLLERLLDVLLGVLTLGGLLEGVAVDGTLEGLELEHVTGGEEVGVVDDLDERLDLGSLGDLLLAHRLGHLEGVTANVSVGVERRDRDRYRGASGRVGEWERWINPSRLAHRSIPATMAWG